MWRALNRPGMLILALPLAVLTARSYADGLVVFTTSLVLSVAIFVAVAALRGWRERRRTNEGR
jgi:hypothetical protein